jgi:putative heme-binding domain-containing protein
VLELIAALGGPKELGEVLNLVVASDGELAPETKASLLTALVDTTLVRKQQPAGDLKRVSTLFNNESTALQAAAARAVGAWKLADHRSQLATWISEAQTPGDVRGAAINALALLGGQESIDTLTVIAASGRSDFATRSRAIGALAKIQPAAAATQAAAVLSDLPSGQSPESLLKDLLAQKQGPDALAKALAEVKLMPDTAKLTLRVAKGSLNPSPALEAAINKAGSLSESGWKLTDQLMGELVAEVQAKGNAARGEAIFRKASNQCFKCHAIGGAGGVVGPDLVSIGASAQVDYLIESLIAPNAKIKENYHSQSVVTDAGKVITGIVVRETGEELVLRDANDEVVTIAKNSIDERADGRSLMPDGAVDVLTRQELVDLVRFLSELGKVGDYAIGQARVARRFAAVIPDQSAYQRLNRASFDAVAQADPAFTWEPAYATVGGDLPLDELPTFELKKWGAEDEGPRRIHFVRTALEVTSPGKTRLVINESADLMLWLDGKPLALAKEVLLDLKSGQHTLTFAINSSSRKAPLRLELVDEAGSSAKVQWVGGK